MGFNHPVSNLPISQIEEMLWSQSKLYFKIHGCVDIVFKNTWIVELITILNIEKQYEKCVLVVGILSCLKYYTHSDFKSYIQWAKYPQCQIVNYYMITVNFTNKKKQKLNSTQL